MRHPRRILVAAAMAGTAMAALPMLAGASDAAVGRDARARALDDTVHLNEIQVIGSHNSYHHALEGKEYQLRHDFLGDADQALMYTADPLPFQFQSDKVRQIELDAWMDASGGRYATPLIRTLANSGPYDPVMKQPGIKVFHIQDVDYRSSCLTVVICLTQVKDWSHA